MSQNHFASQDIEYKLIRLILVSSLLISISLALVETVQYTPVVFVLLGLIIALPVLLVALSLFHRRGMKLGWFVSLAFLNLFLFVPELGLRVANFQYESGIQFGYPRPSHFVRLDPDQDLFWKLDPTLPDVNSEGFPGDEFNIPKPQDVFRILYLGDSCTYQGYPEDVEHLLNSDNPESSRKIESVTLAVPGYSSHQGVTMTELYGQRLEPDLVVVYFGWNDHWLAYGATDAEKEFAPSGLSRLSLELHRFHLAQLFFWTGDVLAGRTDVPLDTVRVPPDQYAENLKKILEDFQEDSIPVIFITAPTSHYQLGVPDYLVEMNYVRDRNSALSLHKEYNEVVRQISQHEGSYLLDLEEGFNSLSSEELGSLFSQDGIHFTPHGLSVVAERLSNFIQDQMLATNKRGLDSP